MKNNIDYLEKTVIEIFTEDGDKRIKFIATSYKPDKADYLLFVEYCNFDERLESVLDIGVRSYEDIESTEVKQLYTELPDDEALRRAYEACNGVHPVVLNIDDLNINTPEGVYVLN